jgi:hypothetical protein
MAVENDGMALCCVPEKLKTKRMCKVAVNNDGYAIKWVPEIFKDKDMCVCAMKTTKLSYTVRMFIPEKFLNFDPCIEYLDIGGGIDIELNRVLM